MSKKLRHNSKRNSVVLCCNNVKCPEIYPKDKTSVQIRDDDGFIITITKEQARMIPEALDLMEKNDK